MPVTFHSSLSRADAVSITNAVRNAGDLSCLNDGGKFSRVPAFIRWPTQAGGPFKIFRWSKVNKLKAK